MTKTFVFISGPYQGDSYDYRSYEQIDANIAQARGAAKRLAISGIPYFAPHMNSAHFEVIAPTVPVEYWYKMDNIFLDRSSALLMLPRWDQSQGAKAEMERAIEWSKPIFRMFNDMAGNFGGFEDLEKWWAQAEGKVIIPAKQ
ncbi:hypothetical protein LCGC14_1328270 [marine sediment metagenome]|uniref:DUF1937 domain-containing protein n=1 Tax=marine sediment metagenome TaxID=412755 RepID=A0A0F9KHZ8_9ZZZZ